MVFFGRKVAMGIKMGITGKYWRWGGWLAGLVLLWWVAVQCQPESSSAASDRAFGQQFLNLNDSVHYIGKEACRACHADIYESFLQTGMGRSFGKADLHRSKADWSGHGLVYDAQNDFYYQAYTRDSALYIKEFRLSDEDTTHLRVQPVSYIVGSGQHTNSHLFNINGYVYQLPMTYYTQEGKWDLPPGFESNNVRFARTIETECMTCHNAYPQQVPGSENKYLKIEEGIDCERCHGPGSLHLAEKLAGHIVDTAKGPDYTIVNPKRLPVSLQMSICQRCHMQGNAVLKPGKDFFDFKPGMMLEDVMSVFLPRYEGDQSSFTMASHPDRMMQSACFKQSNEQLSCISCHNPHKSIEVTPAEHYNNACTKCHTATDPCSLPMGERIAAGNNCVSCHMPKSGTSDIPHVTITDHWIRKPEGEKQSVKRSFAGLASINEKRPSALTIGMAWLQYFERFDAKRSHLDSAAVYLRKAESEPDVQGWFNAKIHWYFLRGDAEYAVRMVLQFPEHAAAAKGWTAYRIAELMQRRQRNNEALAYYAKAVDGMPYQLDFQLKMAVLEMQIGELELARMRMEKILAEQPTHVATLSNLGFVYLQLGNDRRAEYLYKEALALDPDHQQSEMNLIGVEMYRRNTAKAKKMLQELLKKYPDHVQAKQLLQTLAS